MTAITVGPPGAILDRDRNLVVANKGHEGGRAPSRALPPRPSIADATPPPGLDLAALEHRVESCWSFPRE